MSKNDVFYVRNARPNEVRFYVDGVKYILKHRGHREDSTALPTDATNDPTVSRWLKNGMLEKISRESFTRLASRTVDVSPNEYLDRKVRSQKGWATSLQPADGDATKSLTQISDKNTQINATPSVEWAGELMSTDEELEEFLPGLEEGQEYPSKYRNEEQRRAQGY